ncbi:Uncharacterized protein TCM_015092 [Theobroma cacao]|uniref:Uncharacterized protein n=1 Tax=Theobroma cacao TaxID=3641 RepID=A0A061G0K6_THECC|nr:Uncharacterized protein TCM_015092 [Theobroma cacao]
MQNKHPFFNSVDRKDESDNGGGGPNAKISSEACGCLLEACDLYSKWTVTFTRGETP